MPKPITMPSQYAPHQRRHLSHTAPHTASYTFYITQHPRINPTHSQVGRETPALPRRARPDLAGGAGGGWGGWEAVQATRAVLVNSDA